MFVRYETKVVFLLKVLMFFFFIKEKGQVCTTLDTTYTAILSHTLSDDANTKCTVRHVERCSPPPPPPHPAIKLIQVYSYIKQII